MNATIDTERIDNTIWSNLLGWWCACPVTGMHLGPFATQTDAEGARRE